jgi:eukaryotic-like serine/threonine-protein kinase
MTEEGRSRVPESVRNVIQSHHPGIADEIEVAIRTLRKLKEIAGPPVSAPPSANGNGSDQATIAATAALVLPSGTERAGGPSIAQTEVEPVPGRGVPTLGTSTSFGRYQIVRLLGKGAMGAVYLAYDTQLHRHVALKTPSLENTPLTIERFLREARSAAQIRSPYLCPIYDVGQIGSVYYLSMAFLDGQPLSRVIAQGLLKTVGDIAGVTRKIARGLQKTHEHGIIHRDLKPDNIMIDEDGEPIVMDFGLARRFDEDSQVTMSGVIIGTPGFMSPEQVEGDPTKIGPAADIYSLGVVLYQMLTARLPFQGSLTSILRQIGTDPPPRPSEFNTELGKDSALERICLKMMAKSPLDRYSSMSEVAAVLEEFSPRDEVQIVRSSALSRIKSWTSGIFSSVVRPASTIRGTTGGSSERPAIGPEEATIAQ